MHPGYDNPRVTLTTGRPYGALPPCIGCDQPVDSGEDYLALLTGNPRRPDLLAAAHPQIWTGPGGDDCDTSCAHRLHDHWAAELHAAGAGTLRRGCDAGGTSWYLHDNPLHAGTPLDLLAADGHWLKGRFDYQLTQHGPIPHFYVGLAGWTNQDTALTLPPTAVLRDPGR